MNPGFRINAGEHRLQHKAAVPRTLLPARSLAALFPKQPFITEFFSRFQLLPPAPPLPTGPDKSGRFSL